MDLKCAYFIPTLNLAQFNSRFAGEKCSANIIKPGIPKIQPCNIGINPPINPIMTKNTPIVILIVFRIISHQE
jgi:hypothetical protein